MDRRTSLAEAKEHLAELVDAAEQRGERAVILRNGRAAAAIVPISHAPRSPKRSPRSDAEARASLARFIEQIGACQPDVSAVDDLLAGRR